MTHITTATTVSFPLGAYGLTIQVNSAMSAGVITVSDTNGVQAIITNPNAQSFSYYGFSGAVSVVTTGTVTDITVSVRNHQ